MSIKNKLIVVGDGDCGKTCLLIAFVNNVFNADCLPTVFETYVASVTVEDTTVELMLCDTSGQEDYDRLRPIQYPETNVVLMCFSVMWRDSLDNVLMRWHPEVRHFCPNVPILLIGTKSDLRGDEREHQNLMKMRRSPVTSKDAQEAADKIGAVCYIECSAKTRFNVRHVFVEAARATLLKRKKKRGCVLL